MGARWVVARRDLAGVFRERTILLAVLIMVVVAGFSSVLVVGLSALADPSALPAGAEPALAVERGAVPEALAVALADAGVRLRAYPTRDAAWAAFAAGDADGALEVAGQDPVRVTLALPDGDLRATVTLLKAKEALEAYQRALRDAAAARLTFSPLYLDTGARGGSYGFAYALLLPLLAMLPVVLAGALCADSVTEEVQRGTMPLLLASPASPAQVVEGKLLANVATAPLLTAAWLGLLALNGIAAPLPGAAAIVALVTAGALLMGVLGCAVALAVRDRNRAQVVFATAFVLVLVLAALLPLSPGAAVAQLAAGSATPQAHAVVAGAAGAAVLAWVALRLALPWAMVRADARRA